jgi:hypothetical protein
VAGLESHSRRDKDFDDERHSEDRTDPVVGLVQSKSQTIGSKDNSSYYLKTGLTF